MVIVQLLGGMGNQMFQFALGRSLSLKNGTQLKVDTSILTDHGPGVHAVNRNFDLEIFSAEVVHALPREVWRYNWHGLGVAGKVAGRIHRLLMGNPGVNERSFSFDPEVLRLSGNIYLAGLWQSHKYFADIEPVIRDDFRLKAGPEGKAAAMLSRVGSRKAVCVNVRRGDFVTHGPTAKSLGFVGLDYYQKAGRLLRQQYEGLEFFVFSDEVEWCRANLGFLGKDTTFVGHDCAGPKFGWYLEIMKACRHFIIPNSTFAWWAAWLSDAPDKIVVAPRQWFQHDRQNADDLIPREWIRV